MLWTIFRCFCDLVAFGLRFPRWRKSDPLAAGCGVGGSDH